MGVSRHTEYSQLSRDEVFLEVNAQRSSKLDAYRDTIRTGMDQFDVSGTVLLRELCCQGYQGGIAILREYIRLLKASLVRRATERFETLPERGVKGLGQARLDSSRIGPTSVFAGICGISPCQAGVPRQKSLYAASGPSPCGPVARSSPPKR